MLCYLNNLLHISDRGVQCFGKFIKFWVCQIDQIDNYPISKSAFCMQYLAIHRWKQFFVVFFLLLLLLLLFFDVVFFIVVVVVVVVVVFFVVVFFVLFFFFVVVVVVFCFQF